MAADERYDRLRRLFDRAHPLPAAEREAFLRQECGDADLLDEVRGLLEADGREGGFELGESGIASLCDTGALVGATIGQFRIEELIESGGMGSVYRARQDHPDRQVALKVVRPHALSPRLVRRFELEAEVLGRLDHPGIAQIYSAATADSAHGHLPYFAMELVQGEPLTRFAATHDLSTRERVALLARVCDAVHHAHINGVIHRDLKPANILVREDGQPKVLDFGVARITDADLQATTLLTDSGLIIGTLSYMSPEQVRGRHDEIDIRTDIYALGTVGYELLTGRLPLDLAGKTMAEAALVIENQAPRSLSDVGEPVPRDLETIIASCIDKDKERRYSSAAEMAADLRRYLGDQPIQARPPTVPYQLAKLARRNRALVAGAAVGVMALVVGLVISLAGWNAAARARTRAETEAAKATLLNSYLTTMLTAPTPWADGRDVKVIDILESAGESLGLYLADQPEVAALALHHLGITYAGLEQYEEAETHIRRALETSSEVAGFPLGDTIEMLVDLGYVRLAQGDLDEAETILEAAVADAAAQLGPESRSHLKAMHQLAILRWEQDDLAAAERLFRECLDGSLATLGPDHEDTIVTTTALGNVLRQAGKLDEAMHLLEAALSWNLEHRGEDHPGTAVVVNNLAFVYQELEQHAQALQMFEKSLALRRRVHGNDSARVLFGLNNLGLQLGIMGRGAEALQYLEEAMEIAVKSFEPDDWRLLAVRSTYGRTLTMVGRHAEAEAELLASLEGFRSSFGDEHWRTQAARRNLAELYRATKEPAKAVRFEAPPVK